MSLLRNLLILLTLSMLSACGGGGDSQDNRTSISLSVAKADFQQQVNTLPPSSIVVDVQFKGDGVVVGYPPNVAEARWLNAQVVSSSQTTAKVELKIVQILSVGRYSTTLRFLTGKQDGSNLNYVDLPVTAEIYPEFNATAPALDFVQIIGDEQNTLPKAGFEIAIDGLKSNWTISTNVDWLTFTKTSGSGPAKSQVTVQKNAGSGNGIITVTDALSKQKREFAVRVVRQTNQLKVKASPQDLTVSTTTSPAQAVTAVTLSDSVDSTVPNLAIGWTFKQASAPWLKVDKTQGSTASAQVIQVSIDPTINAAPAGTYNEQLVFTYTTSDNVSRELEVPIKVTSELPSIQVAAPYVITPNTAGTIIIRGHGFNRLSANSRIKIGENLYPIKTQQSETQLKVEHPGLAAGVYPVSLDLNSAFPLKGSNLVVKTSNNTAAQTLDAPGNRTVMLFDDEREQIYAYNSTTELIEIFSYQQGKWSLSWTKDFADVRAMALTKDGTKLIATRRSELWSFDLTQANWPATLLLNVGGASCNLNLATVATLNDNKVAVSSFYNSCSGYSNLYMFDLTANKTFGNLSAYNASVGASKDGSKLLISQTGLSPAPGVLLLDSLAYQTIPTNLSGNYAQAELNTDGSRIMFGDATVFDENLQRHGLIGNTENSLQQVEFSPKEPKAWVLKYRYEAPFTLRLEVVDISKPSATNYPLLSSAALTDLTDAIEFRFTTMLVTPDDQTAIISIPNKIIFQPLSVLSPVQ